jgi:hypothetical protein
MQKQKTLFISLRCGRLANRLIIFATFIALAEEYGYRVINFTFHSYAELFETTRRDIYCQYPVPRRRSWMDIVPGIAAAIRKTRIFYHLTRLMTVLNERFQIFGAKIFTLMGTKGQHVVHLDDSEAMEKIRKAKIVFVYEWRVRATRLVQKHAEKIRNYFQPVEKLDHASREAVELLRRVADIVVGIHIRHGDYRRWKGGKYFFPAFRYAEWMREMTAQFPDRKVAFLVCSDEPRSVDEFPGLLVGFGGASPVSDLYALSKCDYIIGPVSTFSQWASFHGEKPLFHLHDSNAAIKLENFKISYLDLVG